AAARARSPLTLSSMRASAVWAADSRAAAWLALRCAAVSWLWMLLSVAAPAAVVWVRTRNMAAAAREARRRMAAESRKRVGLPAQSGQSVRAGQARRRPPRRD